MSITPSAAPTLDAEVEGYFASNAAPDTPPNGGESPPESEAPAPVTTSEPASEPPIDFWNQTVNDPDLPPSLHGKTLREAWDENKRAIVREKKAGFEKNEALAQLQVAQAANAALMRQLQSGLPAAQPYEALGVHDPNQIITQPEAVLNQIPQFVNNAVQQAADQIRETEVAPLRNDLLRIQGDAARESARQSLGIPADVWNIITPSVAAIMAANQLDPRNGEAWGWAAEQYRQQAARLVPAQVTNPVSAPLAGNAKPSTAAPTLPKKAATTGNKHIDRALRDQLDVWNSVPGIKKMSIEDFTEMLSGDLNGGFGQ